MIRSNWRTETIDILLHIINTINEKRTNGVYINTSISGWILLLLFNYNFIIDDDCPWSFF